MLGDIVVALSSSSSFLSSSSLGFPHFSWFMLERGGFVCGERVRVIIVLLL
jgi:hypothetical protein